MIKWKDYIGKEIFLIPMQNSINRIIPIVEQIKPVTLLKVGTKKLQVSSGYEFGFYKDGSLDVNNYGWLPFASKEDALKHLDIRGYRWKLQSLRWKGIDDATIEQIVKILKGHLDD